MKSLSLKSCIILIANGQIAAILTIVWQEGAWKGFALGNFAWYGFAWGNLAWAGLDLADLTWADLVGGLNGLE